jgi:AbrB family looped-hinge helix DNA binding protein
MRGDSAEMSVIKILNHGQITIPKQIRDVLGLKRGYLAEAELEGDRIVITPKKLTPKKETLSGISKKRMPERLTNPRYGREEQEKNFEAMASNAPGMEKVWQITERLPSFSELISEGRDNE